LIPQSTIESIRERQSITELVGETVELKRSGSRFSGLCPFHSEKTPSFYVNEEEGFYHCFGCGAHGDIFNFVMDTRNVSFVESVKILAERKGIALPVNAGSENPEERKKRKLRLLLRELMQHVAATYHSHLLSDEKALAYFKSRGIDQDLIERFQLGYAPDKWNFILDKVAARLEKLDNVRLPLEPDKLATLMALSGVLKTRNSDSAKGAKGSNSFYDSFRDRVIFPISRSDGVVTALGGRVIDAEGQPKYINSPETLIYKKRKTLYGLSQALKNVRKTRSLFLVEGYMDVLALARNGVENAVASCGTALTAEHVQVLQRISEKVFVLYDGDFAGQKAAAESFEVFSGSGLEVFVVVLPKGMDPDDFASSFKEESGLEKVLEGKAVPLAEFFLKLRLFGENAEFGIEVASVQTTAARQGKVAEDFAKIVGRVGNLVEKELLVKKGSELLGVSFESLSGLVELSQQKFPSAPPVSQPGPAVKVEPNYEQLISQDDCDEPGAWERQVLVAVVSKPSLAEGFLGMFKNEEAGGAGQQKFSSRVREFIEEISREMPGALPASEKSLVEMLEKHGLTSYGIVEEAKKQLAIGGGRPERVLGEAEQVQTRLGIQSEIERITLAEGKCSAEERQVLIRRKLALKKKLSQISAS